MKHTTLGIPEPKVMLHVMQSWWRATILVGGYTSNLLQTYKMSPEPIVINEIIYSPYKLKTALYYT